MAAREGPPEVSMKSTDSSSSSARISRGVEVNNSGSGFETFKADVCVRSGKWFYEVKIGNSGRMQFGFATDKCKPRVQGGSTWGSSGSGVGNDSESWAYDGSRQKKLHGDSEGERYGQSWSSGDHIGVLLDCDARTMTFYRNGDDLGVAFTNVDVGSGLFPAGSFQKKTKATFNFGKSSFKYNIPEVFPDVRPLHVKLTAAQGKSLLELFVKYKDIGLSMSESGEISGEDHIKGVGSLELAQALGAESDDDPLLMMVAWKLNAKTKVWEFSRDQWVTGWSVFGCGTIDEMRDQCKTWKAELQSDTRTHRAFYNFVFEYLREAKTQLSTEEAIIAWTMLDMPKRWEAMWPVWVKFLEADVEAITADTWKQFYNFYQEFPTKESLSKFDEDDLWPSTVDAFVERVTKDGLSASSGAAGGKKKKKSGDDSDSDSDSSSSSSSED